MEEAATGLLGTLLTSGPQHGFIGGQYLTNHHPLMQTAIAQQEGYNNKPTQATN